MREDIDQNERVSRLWSRYNPSDTLIHANRTHVRIKRAFDWLKVQRLGARHLIELLQQTPNVTLYSFRKLGVSLEKRPGDHQRWHGRPLLK
jgi:hypothetical protein